MEETDFDTTQMTIWYQNENDIFLIPYFAEYKHVVQQKNFYNAPVFNVVLTQTVSILKSML